MAYDGACLCGGIRFRVLAALAPIQLCYCSQCRRAQGGPFAAVIPVPAEALQWLAGEHLLQAYASSNGKERVFCQRCGSPVFSRREALPGVLRMRAGLFEGPLPVAPSWHAYTASACNWWPIPQDGLPRFAQGQEGTPADPDR